MFLFGISSNIVGVGVQTYKQKKNILFLVLIIDIFIVLATYL